jgi:hypothetical protein
MSVLTPAKGQKVHFSEYIRTWMNRSDEPTPAENTEAAEPTKPAEPAAPTAS